jgi:large subunit ribosomal protein L28
VDNYLLGEKEQRIKELGESGWWLRWAIMQTPAIKKRFAADRQRMGLPELSEVLEEVEIEETLDEGNSEALSTDDAFSVEAAPNKPRIKFRVGRGQHIYLTENGWRRTRPDPMRWINAAKAKIEETKYSQYMTEHTAKFAEELKIADAIAPANEKLTPEEISLMTKVARQRIRRRLDEQLELDYQRSQEARQLRRVAKAKERNAAERARRAQEAESDGSAKIGGFNYVAADIDPEIAIGAAQVESGTVQL